MTELLRFQVRHVTTKDVRVLRSLIGLAASQVDLRVTVSEDDEGDVILVDVDDEEGAAVWQEVNRGSIPCVALSKQRDFPARFLLTKPIRSQQLIQLLTELTSADARSEGGDANDASSTAAWAVMSFGNDNLPLAEHLRRHTWDGSVRITGEGLPEIIIDTGSGAWYSGASDRELARLLEHNFAAADAESLTSAALIDATNGLEQNNLTNLKWRAGLALSTGALHPDLAGEIRLMLPQVPMQALSDTAYSRQARLLIREPMTADELAEAAKADRSDVAEFLNACHCCGFLLLDSGSAASAHG